jgi:phosphoheptose isomerase
MKQWIADYIRVQKAAHDSISIDGVAQLIEKLRDALKEDKQIFVFGNGGSASNSSHFATDLGKGASDKVGKRFRVISLNDNVSWMTAIGYRMGEEEWPTNGCARRREAGTDGRNRRTIDCDQRYALRAG